MATLITAKSNAASFCGGVLKLNSISLAKLERKPACESSISLQESQNGRVLSDYYTKRNIMLIPLGWRKIDLFILSDRVRFLIATNCNRGGLNNERAMSFNGIIAIIGDIRYGNYRELSIIRTEVDFTGENNISLTAE